MGEKLWVDHIFNKKGEEINTNIGEKNTKSSLSILGNEFLKPSELTTFLVYTLIGGTKYNTLSQGNISDILGTPKSYISRETGPLNKLIKKGYIEKTQIGNNITHSNNKYELKKEKPFNFDWSIFLNLPNAQNIKSKALGLYLLIRSNHKVVDKGINYGNGSYRTTLKELKALYHDTSNNNDKIAEYLSYLMDNNLIRIHLNKENNSKFIILFPQEKIYKIEALNHDNEEYSKIPAKISEIVSVPERKVVKNTKNLQTENNLRELLKEANDNYQILEFENDRLIEKNNGFIKKYNELYNKYEELENENNILKEEIKKLNETNEGLKGSIYERAEHEDRLTEEIKELKAEIERLKSIPNSITQQEIVSEPSIDLTDFNF